MASVTRPMSGPFAPRNLAQLDERFGGASSRRTTCPCWHQDWVIDLDINLDVPGIVKPKERWCFRLRNTHCGIPGFRLFLGGSFHEGNIV